MYLLVLGRDEQHNSCVHVTLALCRFYVQYKIRRFTQSFYNRNVHVFGIIAIYTYSTVVFWLSSSAWISLKSFDVFLGNHAFGDNISRLFLWAYIYNLPCQKYRNPIYKVRFWYGYFKYVVGSELVWITAVKRWDLVFTSSWQRSRGSLSHSTVASSRSRQRLLSRDVGHWGFRITNGPLVLRSDRIKGS